MKNTAHNPTMMIKSKFSNLVHKILEPNMDVKQRERWRFAKKYKFTDEEKLQIFDQILKIHNECSKELTHYQFDRREKRRVIKEREKKLLVNK